MAPELVIANSAYKVYPGGVIALRCSDWLGPARATLSTEADARSVCGTVVRDAQKVTTSIFDTDRIDLEPSAYQEADPTLVIDTSLIPELELSQMNYRALVSILIEGDWDPTNNDTTRGGSQELFANACWMGLHGDDGRPADTNPNDCNIYMPRGLDSYRYTAFVAVLRWGAPTEIIVKAYSQTGTTIEWLLDQIILLPYLSSGVSGDWTNDDFELVDGQIGSFENVYALDPTTVPGSWPEAWVDGADGGDSNSKFTWQPLPYRQQTFLTLDGGGDYQKDDSEYMARVRSDLNGDGSWSDFEFLRDSEDTLKQDPPSHCYGLHGPLYMPAQTWVDEDFARNTGGDHLYGANDQHFEDHEWGTTPEGFYWRPDGIFGPTFDAGVGHDHGGALYCDSLGRGVIANRVGDNPVDTGAVLQVTAGIANGGAGLNADHVRIVGSFEVENMEPTLPDSMPFTQQPLWIATFNRLFVGQGRNGVAILMDMRTGKWLFGMGDVAPAYLDNPGLDTEGDILYGPTTETWWDYDVRIGFRIEVHRFIVRVKLWEYAAGEPGAWTFEGPMAIRRGVFIDRRDYPYGDDLHYSIEEGFNPLNIHTLNLSQGSANHRFAGSYAVKFYNDLVITYDPEGTNESAWALMEKPEGNEVGRIEMPAGCQHLVYWGKRSWSQWEPALGSNYIDFSSKVWNDPTAAELQRSEAIWWWFRISRAGGFVSMNWRSSQRNSTSYRVLTSG